ncbi:MAG: hypothetical protein KAW90_08080, partial [Dehalococcoidales bacterium]|nr:hypothetical protein [Dehalococcoidales bacterium]
GYTRIRPEIKNIVLELLESADSAHLLEPTTAYEIYPVTGMDPDKVLLEGDAVVSGSLIPSTFPEAKELAAIVCTIGPGLEKQVTEYSQGGETLRAMLLDGIGSAAVDTLVIEVCHCIANEASSRGLQAGSPVNPGMPGLTITEQGNLLGLARAGDIGVNLTSSGIMVPRKSTSLILALGPKMETWTQADVCARCNLRDTCPYTVLHS